MMRRASVLVLLLAAIGCDGGEVPRCVPGTVQACPCAGGGESTQTCDGDGAFGACACEGAGDGGVGLDGGAGLDGGDPGDAGSMDAGAGLDGDVPTDGAVTDGSAALDGATDGGGVGVACDDFRVRFDARRDRAMMASSIRVRLYAGASGWMPIGTIDFPTGELMPYEFALPTSEMLEDDRFLEVTVTNGSVENLVIEHGGGAYMQVDAPLADGISGSFDHRFRVYVPTECNPSLSIPTETETMLDVTLGRSLRVEPGAGEAVYVWAHLGACTAGGMPYSDGSLEVDFVPDGASWDATTRGMRRLERNPYDVDVVFEDVRIGDTPGTLFFTSSTSDPLSPYRYDCQLYLRTQYR